MSLNWDTDVLKELTSGEDPIDISKFWTSTELESLFPTDEQNKKKLKGMDQGDDLRYQIVIDCDSEAAQTAMLDRFEGEGIKCKPLIS